MLGYKKKQQEVFEIRPSAEEMKAVFDIINERMEELENWPEPRTIIDNVFFGCTADSLYMSGEPFDVMDDAMPPFAVFTSSAALTKGRHEDLTPRQLGRVMFCGPESGNLVSALAMVLVLERDRRRNGEVDGVHLPNIRDNLHKVLECMNVNASDMEFSDED